MVTKNKMGFAAFSIDESDRIYMIVTDRFYDGNPKNNGILGQEYRPGNLSFYQGGDWNGIMQKLPYIKKLGFTAIWISAPQDNELFSRSGDEAGYHGYYTRDFSNVNPHFGTAADLADLILASADLHIKVILDVQLNHTADYLQYPSLTYDPPEYYPAPPFNNPSWYHNYPNIVDFSNPEEMQNFSLGGLDDLAQENPECFRALKEAYWNPDTQDGWFSYGFAGSRIDAVLEIPPQYLEEFQNFTCKPAFGEALTGSVDENAALAKTLWGMLDYPLYFQMNKVFCQDSFWEGIHWIFSQDYKYPFSNRLFTFLDNHDRARFLANAGDSFSKLRLALTFLYAVRGIPVIYYGTEQNMAGDYKYSDENLNRVNRESMTSFSTETTTFVYLEHLNHIRSLYTDLFSNGMQIEQYFNSDDRVYAFSRELFHKTEAVLCIFNNSPVRQERQILINSTSTVFIPGRFLVDLLNSNNRVKIQDSGQAPIVAISIPAYGAMLLSNEYTGEYIPPVYRQTTIRIHYDAGWGNRLTIRGNSVPLNWEWGQPCDNINCNLWQYVLERPLRDPFLFKILLNDSVWEAGENHCIREGETKDLYISFHDKI
ncbi:alpha-amylase family glycosyl hydrolase [Diplocloster modestus]|uniref:Alpha-amylase n=1 Tax=Diplocloster modestus TaxID=2850322 RepID=A0ABS6K4Y2_9FIRM|nr:alpha-amylase family glycosyl hydrolase [Diplocloster modestus]MBU9725601.1 alpha-amylase [Diplocloster modestus]